MADEKDKSDWKALITGPYLEHNEDTLISEIMLKLQKAEVYPLHLKVGRGSITIKCKQDATMISLGMLMALDAKEIEDNWNY